MNKTTKKAANSGRRLTTHVVYLLTAFGIMLSLSLVMNGRLFGSKIGAPEPEETIMQVAPDGTVTINTTTLGADVEGYAGAVPLLITIRDHKILSVEALDNDETPSFFDEAFAALAPSWQGKSVADAAGMQVDAYSGATYSSDAIIENVSRALKYYIDNTDPEVATSASKQSSPLENVGWWLAILVALSAAVMPFFVHSRAFRTVQLIANVGVLGFWTGTFLSYTVIFSLFSGAPRVELIPAWLLLAIAFILPLFGPGNRYCSWVCPLGSLQELAGMTPLRRVKLSPKLVKGLTWFHRSLWAVLMLLIWSGVYMQWIDYELFIGFFVETAPAVVLWVAGAFILLSIFISRPFCRFVCPVGALINLGCHSTAD